MSSSYAYDEDGHLWPSFVFTLTSIVTLPLAYVALSRSTTVTVKSQGARTNYKHAHSDVVDALRKCETRKDRKMWLWAIVACGFAVMAYTLFLVFTIKGPQQKMWNPYDILGISESATEKVIKSTYRRLSRKLHPDKYRPDENKNETTESVTQKYIEVLKAYQALTDEEVRNNYIQFGNPDGKQGFSMNIALPKAMVSDGNGKYIVLLYAFCFGILLPYMVGSWWYGTLRRSKEGVLMESANRLFREYQTDINDAGVIAALSIGKEFEDVFKGDKSDSSLSRIETRIFADGASALAGGMTMKEKEVLQRLESGPQRKALLLLWAYLGRLDLGEAALEKAKFEVAPIAYSLNQSLVAIALAYMNSRPLLASYHAGQLLMQAIPPKASPLLQLPHFTPAVVQAIEGDSRIHTTVQEFMDKPDAVRRRLAVGRGLLTPEQYKEAVHVAKQLPYFCVTKAFFKVTGERFIIPSSLVTLVVKGRFIPPGSEKVPEINELDLEDIDPAEDDLEVILGRKVRQQIGKDEKGKPIMAEVENKPVTAPLAAAPYFARDHVLRWNVFLTDSKQGRVAVPPFTFTQFQHPLFGDAAEGEAPRPTFAMQTLKAQFQAPPQAGHYTFVMHVVCDSYVDMDTKMQVTLVVDEASKAEQILDEEEPSEPDEDTIAGIMNVAKSGARPSSKPKRKQQAAEKESSEEEESATEEENDTSDTNTDTEPEDEGNPKSKI